MLRFAHDLAVPPTSNQAERDLAPANANRTSRPVDHQDRTQDRYTIRGYISTAIHGHNALTVLRDALLGRPWMPDLPHPPDTPRPRPDPARPPQPAGNHSRRNRVNVYSGSLDEPAPLECASVLKQL